jgi:hypothetical protein
MQRKCMKSVYNTQRAGEMTSSFSVFLTTVICRRHKELYVDCDCDTPEWMPVYERGEAVVIAMQHAAGCSQEEAWAQWADDNASETGTDAVTIAYDAVNGDIAFLPSLDDLSGGSDAGDADGVSDTDTLADTILYDNAHTDDPFLEQL